MHSGNTRTGFLFIIFIVLSRHLGSRGEISSNPSNSIIVAPPADSSDVTHPSPDGEKEHLPLFTFNYQKVQIPFEITLWMLLASFAKIGK